MLSEKKFQFQTIPLKQNRSVMKNTSAHTQTAFKMILCNFVYRVWLLAIETAIKKVTLALYAARQKDKRKELFIKSGWINSSVPACLWESCCSFQGSSETSSCQNIPKPEENACWSAVFARSEKASTGTGIVLWSFFYCAIVSGIENVIRNKEY